jgi:hypothetical protein
MGKRRGAYRILVGKCEGKRQLGGDRRRGEDNGSSGSGMGRHGLD